MQNGKRRDAAFFFSGGVVTLALATIGFLVTLGGERQRVLGHVEIMAPVRDEVVTHLKDASAHLSVAERQAVAETTLWRTEVNRRLEAIERTQEEILRRVR